jgi:AraC family transcriptional regulator of arabinose operon
MSIPEGFAGQRMVVVPRPSVDDALRRPVTRRLLATDAGFYPSALHHGVRRRIGISEAVLIVCTDGAGWANVDGTVHRLGTRQALVVPSGTPHSYGSDDRRPWTIWWIHLAGTDVAEILESMDVSAARPVLSVRGLERVVSLLDEIVSTLERDQSPARLVSASGAAWKLLAQMSADRLLPERGDPLQRAMAYLSERLDGTITVTDLARLVGVSPSHLTALFRRATGGGVLAHHIALRMSHARHLLDTTTATVAEIARDVGYSDAFYFSRHFRRHHGVSPTHYRHRDDY